MMVGSYDDQRLLLILQVDHSKITGWFAAHWGMTTSLGLRPTLVARADCPDWG